MAFKVTSSLAQSQPTPARPATPDPDYQQLTVPVPRAVSLVTDVASVLFSRSPEGKSKVQEILDRRHKRSETGDQSLRVSIPKNGLTRTLGLVE
ncbi:hypothetical protein [Hymenobacter properus]|uniref:Uncharacterized protein n=1 Tax=Hymenobacter properus TaxID=2791026 RepID=A0A931BL14_9BACT|nr:hypothetical protein [Hymenobacter properus]MBF9143366.1 hypothetical protein [Hymenobacter properus]MBR7722177.1 hypothetical protein [Microvirga sp. SRT04]